MSGVSQVKKKLLVAMVLCVILLLAACSRGNDPDPDDSLQPAPSAGYSVPAQDINEEMDSAIVAKCGSFELTNELFQYFYWLEYATFVYEWQDSIRDSPYFDPYAPLAGQKLLSDDMTWQEYFISTAYDTYWMYQVIIELAKKDSSFELSNDYRQKIEQLPEQLDSDASDLGYDSADQMLQQTFFETATKKGYLKYFDIYMLFSAYVEYLHSNIDYSEADIEYIYNRYFSGDDGGNEDIYAMCADKFKEEIIVGIIDEGKAQFGLTKYMENIRLTDIDPAKVK